MKDTYFTRSNAPRQRDFTPSMLPRTRRSQLKHLLKTKLFSMYKAHLLTAVWFLPLLAWHYFSLSYTNAAFSGTPEASLRELPNYCLTVYGTAVPLWMLAFAGLAGGMYVLRRMAWGEHVRPWKDFQKGVKQSGGQFAAIGLVFAALLSVFRFAFYWLSFYQQVTQSSMGLFIAQVSALIAIGVLGGVTVFVCNMASLYCVSLLQAWIGGFQLFFGKLFGNCGVVIISIAPMLVPMLLGSFLGRIIGYFVLLVGGLGFGMLLWVLLGLARCDACINKTDYPDNYLRGLAGGKREAVTVPEIPAVPAKEEETEDDFEILP